MRNYKKEYQQRKLKKKELRCYVDIEDYKSLENRLAKHNLKPSKWLQIIANDIIHDGMLHDRILKIIEELECKIKEEERAFLQ